MNVSCLLSAGVARRLVGEGPPLGSGAGLSLSTPSNSGTSFII